jgi:hypothetical protein
MASSQAVSNSSDEDVVVVVHQGPSAQEMMMA